MAVAAFKGAAASRSGRRRSVLEILDHAGCLKTSSVSASDESSVVTGGVFPIDAGYMAFKANVDLMGVTGGEN